MRRGRVVVAKARAVAHSRRMDDIRAEYYWCVRHERVERGEELCPARFLLGPYDSRSDARRALQDVDERNEAWEAEDRAWESDE